MTDPTPEGCECVAYTARTDYGTGVEHDVDTGTCPVHSVGPTLPHGTQPTERQWQIAEALDDLISERGVILDDDRLDWLADWVQARQATALVEAADLIEKYGTTFDAGERREGIDVAALLLRLRAGAFGA